MVLAMPHRCMTDFAALSATDADALLACARMLQRRASNGEAASALRGRNLGLLCAGTGGAAAANTTPAVGDTALLARAAAALGATLARLPPTLSPTSAANEVRRTAWLLGRLYDAIDCEGIATPMVRRIGAEAGVPVFEGLASPRHPVARLAPQLAGGSEDDRRCLLIQAVLLNSVG